MDRNVEMMEWFLKRYVAAADREEAAYALCMVVENGIDCATEHVSAEYFRTVPQTQ